MPTYNLLNGDTIEYAPATPAVADYLERVRAAAYDPNVNLADFVEVMYSDANPVLVAGVIPGKGYVTREVFDDPVYRVMDDLFHVKRANLGMFDPEAGHAAYTVSVTDAAAQLGVSTSAVRQAITARRLAAVKKNGQWWTSPLAIAGYRVSSRGPAPAPKVEAGAAVGGPLHVVCGAAEGVGLKFWHDGEAERVDRDGTVIEETVTGWSRAGVFTYVKGRASARFFELAPADDEEVVQLGPLEVRGRFRIAQRVNNARKASAAFDALAGSQRDNW